MKSEVKKWIRSDGRKFLIEIGIKEGFSVADLGCGYGHYVIPAAKIVSTEGKVYAIEKDKNKLDKLMQTAEKEEKGLSNIIIPVITTPERLLEIDLDDQIVDFALIYDMLHFYMKNERRLLYKSIHRILKPEGILSVYPKHNKSDWPLWNLAEIEVDDIIQEIKESNFSFSGKENLSLFHDEGYNRGIILKFKKN
ncbi:MAG: class I SAM-dependent methyltransferase [Promethearchaeota archaeon]